MCTQGYVMCTHAMLCNVRCAYGYVLGELTGMLDILKGMLHVRRGMLGVPKGMLYVCSFI